MSDDPYGFRPATAADLPMLRQWLQNPEVIPWWGDPHEQAALLSDDLSEPLMTMMIVAYRGRPFGYLQHYDVRSWPAPHFADLPQGARAIDAFIGEADMIGQGHGRAFLRRIAERLRAQGAPAVAIDPGADNARARRAYAAAGFKGESVVDTAEGPSVVMIFDG